jgi:hypothetical protein
MQGQELIQFKVAEEGVVSSLSVSASLLVGECCFCAVSLAPRFLDVSIVF